MAAVSAYMRPDEWWSRGGAVGDTVGTTNSLYTNEWLVDGIPGRPVRSSIGSITWTITNPAGATVDTLVLYNYRIDALRSITIGGTLAASLTAPASRTNGIPYGLWTSLSSSSSVTTMTLSVMANSNAVVVGELAVGKRRLLPKGGLDVANLTDEPIDFVKAGETDIGAVLPYDVALAARRLTGTVRASASDLDDLLQWYDAQKNESLPSAFILDINAAEARIGTLKKPTVQRAGLFWRVGLEFIEYPRSRW